MLPRWMPPGELVARERVTLSNQCQEPLGAGGRGASRLQEDEGSPGHLQAGLPHPHAHPDVLYVPISLSEKIKNKTQQSREEKFHPSSQRREFTNIHIVSFYLPRLEQRKENFSVDESGARPPGQPPSGAGRGRRPVCARGWKCVSAPLLFLARLRPHRGYPPHTRAPRPSPGARRHEPCSGPRVCVSGSG